ncbi:hypothetical protein GDO81_007544 [Engystomops pustulosus]|uniref:Cystatin LXN-type domain-containing protein n=1 Tax=Engystomops pustulosus TaxID=76066 RepID=A0AAV7C870_ENGPU|nr:hypothetical protein GDO81_007544 [Engystomops pustulosus]
MEDINPSYYPATRAAGLAGDKINYDRGGPNRFMEVQGVTKARKEIIAGQGNKYNVEFAIKDSVNEQNPIQCTAEVLYPTNKQSAPNVTYKLQSEPQNNTTAKDQEFYNNMKHRSVPLAAEEIPDKDGNIAPDMKPIWYLALAASSFVKCQNATEDTYYRSVVIDSVKQVVRNDNALEFHFKTRIHQMTTQEMEPWWIEALWDPSGGLKVNNYKRLPKFNPDENSSRHS